MTESMGVHTQLRLKHTRHTYLVGNMLDLGPAGIEVPQVETEATVDEAIDNFLYPQAGVRSWGGNYRYGIANFDDPAEYMKWWNNTGVLWMQIESIHAVASARILAKPGVDCLSWGPMDLRLNLEGHPDHPFQCDDDCVEYAVKLLEGSETKLVYRNYVPELRSKYIDMGVTVLLENPQA